MLTLPANVIPHLCAHITWSFDDIFTVLLCFAILLYFAHGATGGHRSFCVWPCVPICMLHLTLTPMYVNLLRCFEKICVCDCVWSALSFTSSLNLFFLLLVPLCRLELHSSIRWRSAWLSCTCGPPRTHSKSKVELITMFNLPLSIIFSLVLSVITHFVFTPSLPLTYIYFHNLTLSQHQFSICFHFLFALFRFSCYECLFIALYMTYFILFLHHWTVFVHSCNM